MKSCDFLQLLQISSLDTARHQGHWQVNLHFTNVCSMIDIKHSRGYETLPRVLYSPWIEAKCIFPAVLAFWEPIEIYGASSQFARWRTKGQSGNVVPHKQIPSARSLSEQIMCNNLMSSVMFVIEDPVIQEMHVVHHWVLNKDHLELRKNRVINIVERLHRSTVFSGL